MEKIRSKITAIKAGRNPRIPRSKVFLDGTPAFSLDNETILKEKLRAGVELSSAEIDLLIQADHFQRCLNAAFRFLSFRPRSEAETRARLQKGGYAEEVIEQVVAQLKRAGQLDDAAFAEFWKENRDFFRPRSRRMLKMELRQKGVVSEVANEAVEDIDESQSACRAAVSRARTLPVSDYRIFRQRLGSYLKRRGFSYEVIDRTVKQVWQERTADSGQHSGPNEETNTVD